MFRDPGNMLALSFDLVNPLSAWLGQHVRDRTGAGDALETDPGSHGPSMAQKQSAKTMESEAA